MNSAWPRSLGLVLATLFASGVRQAARAGATEPLTADEVVQRMVARSQKTEDSAGKPAYTYTRLTVTEELDSTGKVKERKEKAQRVFFERGITRVKPVSADGRPPARGDARKAAENEDASREKAGPSKRRQGERRDNFLTPEVVERFNFTLLGKQTLNGRLTYQIAFAPKQPPLPVRQTADKVMNRISGMVWVDAEEFEIARAEFSLGAQVDFLGGVIGCLKKLAVSMTRTRMDNGVWLNTTSNTEFEARKLFSSMRVRTRSQCSDFHPLRVAG